MKREIIQRGVRKSVPAKHADILVSLKKAEYADAAPTYQTRAVVAESEDISERTGKPKRKYKRRDMKAED